MDFVERHIVTAQPIYNNRQCMSVDLTQRVIVGLHITRRIDHNREALIAIATDTLDYRQIWLSLGIAKRWVVQSDRPI